MEYDNPAGSLGANDARAADPPRADRVAHRSTRSAHCNREHLVVLRKAPSASRSRVNGVHVRSAGFRHDFLSYRAGRRGDDECRQKGKDEPFAARRQSGGGGSDHRDKPGDATGSREGSVIYTHALRPDSRGSSPAMAGLGPAESTEIEQFCRSQSLPRGIQRLPGTRGKFIRGPSTHAAYMAAAHSCTF
jgi:hypothetical protein